MHYQRLRIHGDPERMKGTPKGAPLRWIKDAVATRTRASGCWLDWPYGTHSDGRPWVIRRYAAVVALELAVGPAPTGTECCHSVECESGACLNPDHLRWDTHAENQRDIRRRGSGRWRNRHGEGAWTAKG